MLQTICILLLCLTSYNDQKLEVADSKYVDYIRNSDLTFDETAKYLNDLIKDSRVMFRTAGNTFWQVNTVQCKKDGKVVLGWTNTSTKQFEVIGSLNVFDIAECDASKLILFDKDGKRLGEFYQMNESEFNRFCKACKHLKTLCSKDADPFD